MTPASSIQMARLHQQQQQQQQQQQAHHQASPHLHGMAAIDCSNNNRTTTGATGCYGDSSSFSSFQPHDYLSAYHHNRRLLPPSLPPPQTHHLHQQQQHHPTHPNAGVRGGSPVSPSAIHPPPTAGSFRYADSISGYMTSDRRLGGDVLVGGDVGRSMEASQPYLDISIMDSLGDTDKDACNGGHSGSSTSSTAAAAAAAAAAASSLLPPKYPWMSIVGEYANIPLQSLPRVNLCVGRDCDCFIR